MQVKAANMLAMRAVIFVALACGLFAQYAAAQAIPRIKARILCEGANGPTTTIADEILADKGVFVIPDILANAGGVTTSYFEWVQDRMGYFWREDVVNERLQDKMVASFNDLCRYAVRLVWFDQYRASA